MSEESNFKYRRNFLIRVQVFVYIHGEIHHVCFAKQIQFSTKELIFFINLNRQVKKFRIVVESAS